MLSRRTALRSTLAALAASLVGAEARAAPPSPPVPITPIPPIPVPIPDMPPIYPGGPGLFRQSPRLAKYVDPLVVPPTVPAHGAALTARSSQHRFHRDLPATRVWGYHDAIQGPVLEARSGEETDVAITYRLGAHPLATSVEVGIGGTTVRDKADPRATLHLHGGETEPDSDGHPMINWRSGGVQRNRYRTTREAATLYYHDHAMGITRLNVQVGLAGVYYLRDEFDTGRSDNPLGLPAGEYEIPLLIQDYIVDAEGRQRPDTVAPLPTGYDQQGLMGDVAVVNGKIWPRLDVEPALYRLRIVIGANTRTYELGFAERGTRFRVIGTDQGLLDAPVETSTVQLGPGERVDALVDFRGRRPGETFDLVNSALNSIGNNILMTPDLREIMRFRVVAARSDPPKPAVAATFRGGPHRPPRIPRPAEVKPDRTRTVTLTYDFDFARLQSLVPVMMSLNNVAFMSDDVDTARAGTVERWDIVNVTDFEHPVHLHLARFLVLGRARLHAAAYMLAHPVPAFGTRWAPPATGFTGPMTPRPAWEAGWKDTVNCPAQSQTSILVFWPSREDLGFDPDKVLDVPHDAEVVHAPSHGGAHGPESGHHNQIRGYVWHCHNLEHEDHDMMQRIRILP